MYLQSIKIYQTLYKGSIQIKDSISVKDQSRSRAMYLERIKTDKGLIFDKLTRVIRKQ